MVEAEVNIPIAVLGAELDQVSPPELVRQFEDILASKPEVLGFAPFLYATQYLQVDI